MYTYTLKIKDKEKVKIMQPENKRHKGTSIRLNWVRLNLQLDSQQKNESQSKCSNILKMLKENYCQPRIVYSMKISFKYEIK